MGAVSTIMAALQAALPSFAKSAGSIEAKIIDVVGTYADSEAVERQNTVNIINDALANQKITGKDYYRRKAVAFQPSDVLLYNGLTFAPYYEKVDPAKQPIKQAYIYGDFPNYTLLINAINTATGHLRICTTQELDDFRTYFEAFQPLGLDIHIWSTQPAKISDSGLVIYIKQGVAAQQAADAINANLLAYESEFRQTNTVSLSEIEDVIQRYAGVAAVSWKYPKVVQQNNDGSYETLDPVDGIFNLINGAFTFATIVSPNIIRTLD